MARSRRGWNSLSASYRKRLERGGIGRREYESGASLSKARGHAETPEHPGDIRKKQNREKYKKYRARREALVHAVVNKKLAIFGHQLKFHRERSASNVRHGPESIFDQEGDVIEDTITPLYDNLPFGVKELQKVLNMDEDEFFHNASFQPPDTKYSFLWYH